MTWLTSNPQCKAMIMVNSENDTMEIAKQRLKIPRDAIFPTLIRAENFDAYAQAYWLAAVKVREAYWKDDADISSPDYIVLPVLYLLHHFVELELKEITRLSNIVGSHEGKQVQDLPERGTHSLRKLLSLADLNLEKLGLARQQPFLTENGRDIITDLEEFGRDGEALRYPEETQKHGGGPTMPERYIANVPAVMRIMEQIANEFAGVIGYLGDWEQFLFELDLEARP